MALVCLMCPDAAGVIDDAVLDDIREKARVNQWQIKEVRNRYIVLDGNLEQVQAVFKDCLGWTVGIFYTSRREITPPK